MKYIVEYTQTISYSKEVEANNEKEAYDLVWGELESMSNKEYYENCEYVDGETTVREVKLCGLKCKLISLRV